MLKFVRKTYVRACVIAVVGLLAAPFSFSAVPLNDYLRSVKQARTEIASFVGDESDLSGNAAADTANLVLKRIVERFPKESEVQYGDYSVPVENGWLSKAQVSFEKELDPAKRKVILNTVDERLESIVAKIEDLERAEERKTSKDYEKQRLSKILEREEFNPADTREESPAAKLYRIVSEWLRSLFPEMKPVDPGSTADFSVLRGVLQFLIFGIVAALIIYLVFRFGPRFLKRAGSRDKSGKKRLILGQEIGPDATTEDLFAEAEVLARSGDIRGAIRKGYISLLFELSQRRLIGLAKHKTNRDYLRDLTKHNEVRQDVTGLTINYERHWYGRQAADSPEWEEFKQGYRDALKHG